MSYDTNHVYNDYLKNIDLLKSYIDQLEEEQGASKEDCIQLEIIASIIRCGRIVDIWE